MCMEMSEAVGTKLFILFFQNQFSVHFPIQVRSTLTHVLYNSKGLENVPLCQRIPILPTAGCNSSQREGYGQDSVSNPDTAFPLQSLTSFCSSEKGDCFASLFTLHFTYWTSLKGPLWGVKLFCKDVWSCAPGGELKINKFLFMEDPVAPEIHGLLWGKGLPHKYCRSRPSGESPISNTGLMGFDNWHLQMEQTHSNPNWKIPSLSSQDIGQVVYVL